MSFTKHNNLEVPDGGVQNWDTSMNENFELIEKGPTIKGIAGPSLVEGKVVYMNISERLELAISPSGSTTASQFLGFTTTAISTEVDGYVQTLGNFKMPDWVFTPGPVFLDASTPGEITQTEPATSTMVGYAIGTNELTIKPWVKTDFGTLQIDTINPATESWVNIQAGLTVGDLNVQGVLSGIDHGELPGILNDDHPQYLRTDMLRSAVGLTITGPLAVDSISPEADNFVTVSAGMTVTGDLVVSGNIFQQTKINTPVIRSTYLRFQPGTIPGTNIDIDDDLTSARGYNSAGITDAVDLTASGADGSFSLDGTGATVTLDTMEEVIGILSASVIVHDANASSTTVTYTPLVRIASGNIEISMMNPGAVTTADWRTEVADAGGRLDMLMSYVTST